MPNGPWPTYNQQPSPPRYFNPPQMNQPRFDPYAELRNPQYPQSQSQPYLQGKVISSPKDIKPNDVPMDGSIGLFPLQDYSAIVARAWNDQGTFDTVVYVPDKPKIDDVKPEDPLETMKKEVFQKFDQLEQLIMDSMTAPTQKGDNSK